MFWNSFSYIHTIKLSNALKKNQIWHEIQQFHKNKQNLNLNRILRFDSVAL